MNSSAKYAFWFLSFVLLVAGIITLMEQIMGREEPSYAGPCGLIGLGLGLGVLAWHFGPPAGDASACASESDDTEDSRKAPSASVEGDDGGD